MQNQENNNVIYAGFFVRLAAYLIDCLLVGCALLILKIPMLFVTLVNPKNILQRPLLFDFSFWDICLYLLGVAYFIMLTYNSGATIGKKALCIKVVSQQGEKLTLLNIIYRETIGRFLSAVIIYIGYFLIGVDSEKRGLHDMLCDTRVIYNFQPQHYKQDGQESMGLPIVEELPAK